MTIIAEQATRLKAIHKGIRTILQEEAMAQKPFIADLNRKQLKAGRRGDGKPMPKYVKGSKQPSAPGRITLFDKGDFHAGIEPIIEDDGIDIISTDEKGEFLIPKYGEEILELDDKSIQRLVKKMTPGLIKRIKAQLL